MIYLEKLIIFVITLSGVDNFFQFVNSEQVIPADKKILITPKIYSNMFIRKREEHKLFVRHLIKNNYEKTYKMLELAFDKILEIISDNRADLHQSGYDPSTGFPTEEKLQNSVTLILENICLSGEIILHLPEISYRVLKRRNSVFNQWKDLFNWGIEFADEFSHITAEETAKLLNLFRQEINISERTEDFVNPYYKNPTKRNTENVKKERKPRKKLKKGPQLVGKTEL